MKTGDQPLLVLTIGILSVWAGSSDVLYRYVRPSTKPWLLLSGAVLIVLALVLIVGNVRLDRREHADGKETSDGPDHDEHEHRPSLLGWALLIPVLVVLLLDPGSLNASSVSRNQSFREPLLGASSLHDYLRDNATSGETPVLPLTVFATAASGDEHELLSRTPARLLGFVSADHGDGTFTIARYQVGCCAADAAPLEVDVEGLSGPVPPVDTWVEVEGTYDSQKTERTGKHLGGAPVPWLNATSITQVREPDEPYEYPGRY